MKLIKKTIIVISIIIVICIIILVILLMIKEENIQAEPGEEGEVLQFQITREQDRDTFFTVEECVNQYINYVFRQDYEKLYYLLDEEYKNLYQITQDNIENFVDSFIKPQNFSAKEMYEIQVGVDQYRFLVKGTLKEQEMEEVAEEKDYYITIQLDYTNGIFTVFPNGYITHQEEQIITENGTISMTLQYELVYMQETICKVTIINQTQETIYANENTILLQYEENINQKLNSDIQIAIQPGEEKEIELRFSNNNMLPQKLVFQTNDEPLSIQIEYNNSYEE